MKNSHSGTSIQFQRLGQFPTGLLRTQKGAYDIPEVHGAFIAWLELTGKGKSSVIDLMVVSKSYGWAMSTDGEVYGLIAGDQGFEKTGIQLSGTDLEIWKLGIEQHDAIEDKLDECNK